MIDPVERPPSQNYYCADWPTYWPYWVGGDKDWSERGQPFYLLYELRITTMLEF